MGCRSRGRTVAFSAAIIILLGGCSQQAATRDDLDHALAESHSALVAARLALETLDRRRTTSAAAETAVQDMSRQIGDAAHTLDAVTISGDRDQTDRDLALAAINDGEAALLTVRDQLSREGRADPAPLASATERVDHALAQIRGNR